MNEKQQRILIGIVIIVAAMLVYPPFQVTAPNGAIFNMGYDWILAPPKRGYIVATVNAPMLMIQWIGILIVGGIAFFLVKNSKQKPQSPSSQTVTATHDQGSLEGPQPITTVENSAILASPVTSFRDPTQLTQWLRYFLYASIVISAIALISGVMEYQLLSDFKLGVYSSGGLVKAAAETNDQRQQVIGILQACVAIVTTILFCMWIYRANFNARALGAQNMKFTPGSAVAYYFIPFLNLWRPYQAMKEIWKASKNPILWMNEERGVILPWWWFLFLINKMLASMAFKKAMRANEIHELINSTVISVASDIVSIPTGIIALLLVIRIYKMQLSHINCSNEIKQRSISSQIIEPSGSNQFTAETSVQEEQRPNTGENKLCNPGTPHLFQKMKGSHKILDLSYQEGDKKKAAQFTFFSLIAIFLAVWIIDATRPPATKTIQQPQEIKTQEMKPQEATATQSNVFPSWYKEHTRSLRDAGRWDELIDMASRWKDIEPESEEAWYLLGEGYLGLSKFPEALAAFRQVIQISPNNQEAWKKVATTYIRAGQPKVARDIARKMKKVDPQLARDIEGLLQ